MCYNFASDEQSRYSQRDTPMSYELISLVSGWHVDQAIQVFDDEVVVIFFGYDDDPDCMVMGETLREGPGARYKIRQDILL